VTCIGGWVDVRTDWIVGSNPDWDVQIGKELNSNKVLKPLSELCDRFRAHLHQQEEKEMDRLATLKKLQDKVNQTVADKNAAKAKKNKRKSLDDSDIPSKSTRRSGRSISVVALNVGSASVPNSPTAPIEFENNSQIDEDINDISIDNLVYTPEPQDYKEMEDGKRNDEEKRQVEEEQLRAAEEEKLRAAEEAKKQLADEQKRLEQEEEERRVEQEERDRELAEKKRKEEVEEELKKHFEWQSCTDIPVRQWSSQAAMDANYRDRYQLVIVDPPELEGLEEWEHMMPLIRIDTNATCQSDSGNATASAADTQPVHTEVMSIPATLEENEDHHNKQSEVLTNEEIRRLSRELKQLVTNGGTVVVFCSWHSLQSWRVALSKANFYIDVPMVANRLNVTRGRASWRLTDSTILMAVAHRYDQIPSLFNSKQGEHLFDNDKAVGKPFTNIVGYKTPGQYITPITSFSHTTWFFVHITMADFSGFLTRIEYFSEWG
jgi:hypothetical protein